MNEPKTFFEESDHEYAQLYRKRRKQNRDLVTLVTDSSNDRGTGKTTLSLRDAYGKDTTDDGITEQKVTIDPHPLIQAYTEQPRGSGLVLDETELGMDKYRAGSAVNRAIRELVATGRIMEKYTTLNAPADHLVDKDLKSLVDVWILVERRGFATVYRMDWAPHQGHELTHKLGTIEWDPIPKNHELYDIYEYISDRKEKRLRGEDGDKFIKRDDAREMVEEAKKEIREETRNNIIQNAAKQDLTHSQIGNIVGLSRSRVSQILSGG